MTQLHSPRNLATALDSANGDNETATLCADFAATLRHYKIDVGPAQALTFYEALHTLPTLTATEIYWAGRATLVSDARDYGRYTLAFTEFFGGQNLEEMPTAQSRPPRTELIEDRDQTSIPPADVSVDDESRDVPEQARVIAHRSQVLKEKAFGAMTDHERREAAEIIRRMPAVFNHQISRRKKGSARGQFYDMRATMRELLATSGEPMNLRRRTRQTRQRPVTFIIDISGSMSAYGNAALRFAHVLSRAGERVEIYTAGVQLHRVTDIFRTPSSDRALDLVGQTVSDWDGGTRLATSLTTLVHRRHGTNAVRGAELVLVSDGLDHDNPTDLNKVMGRLGRLAHRVTWLNPLKADPRYEPLARGMAAALPHIDDFRSGHNISSLESLMLALAGSRGVRGRRVRW